MDTEPTDEDTEPADEPAGPTDEELKAIESDLATLDGPIDVQIDQVPTAEQADPLASYADWRQEDTRIVVCRIANNVYPGERFESRDEATTAIRARCGRILEANYVPGRAFFRVMK